MLLLAVAFARVQIISLQAIIVGPTKASHSLLSQKASSYCEALTKARIRAISYPKSIIRCSRVFYSLWAGWRRPLFEGSQRKSGFQMLEKRKAWGFASLESETWRVGLNRWLHHSLPERVFNGVSWNHPNDRWERDWKAWRDSILYDRAGSEDAEPAREVLRVPEKHADKRADRVSRQPPSVVSPRFLCKSAVTDPQ